MQQPHLPSGWDELTWEQLREVHRLLAEPVEKSVRNLNLYLYLTGLEIAEGEGEVNGDGEAVYYLRRKGTENRREGLARCSQRTRTSSIFNTNGNNSNNRYFVIRAANCLSSIKDKLLPLFPFVFNKNQDEEFFSVKADDLALYLNGCHVNENENENENSVSEKMRQRVERAGALDWVDQPVGKDGQGGLMGLPEEEIVIGRRTFLLPAMLITNLTYEQYSNLQKLQQAVWSYTEQVQGLQKELVEAERELMLTENSVKTAEGSLRKDLTENSENSENFNSSKTDEESSRDNSVDNNSRNSRNSRLDLERIQPIITKIEEAMREVRKYRMQFLAHALLEKEVDRRGVVVSEYKSNVAEVMAPYMEKHAPEWLFDILVQHMQSCLGMYKTQFPELFSKDGGEGRDVIPLVSEVETINAIQKWQGYQEQQKVYDTNAVFVFGILNSMTKEAKAIEEANAKMKSHRK